MLMKSVPVNEFPLIELPKSSGPLQRSHTDLCTHHTEHFVLWGHHSLYFSFLLRCSFSTRGSHSGGVCSCGDALSRRGKAFLAWSRLTVTAADVPEL